MSNPLSLQIPVTQANQTIYATVESFAAYTQRITITLPDSTTRQFQGSGEFVQLGTFTFRTTAAGFYTFTVKVEYQSSPGGPWQLSADVVSASQVVNTLNYTVVFSEDATDDDDNDSFITFRWFYTGGGPR
ncbi:MAG: hypothetical protein HY302_01410 [Opitutae bacterium]|nr:hypothetical protein [Opitutae bacterium]